MNTLLKITFTLLALSLFAFTSSTNKHAKTITAVIDVSHGGSDAGVKRNNVLEKELVQQIAKKMAQLNTDGSLKLHFTRTEDETVALHHRVGFINSIKPDVVLSLHIEDKAVEASGISVYYSDEAPHKAKAQQLADNVLQAFKQAGDFSSSDARKAPFYILKKSEAPAVVIELGNLANSEDSRKLQDEALQTKIAETLLAAISGQ